MSELNNIPPISDTDLPDWMHISPVSLEYWLDVYAKAMRDGIVNTLPPPLIKLVTQDPELQYKVTEKYHKLIASNE